MISTKSPFKFLDSYTKDDREIFFGRDREIEELYHRVFESKIMLVYGVSGTGKSSLIHCGLANKFQDTDWLPIVIRRGGNIIESMTAGIKSASITEQQSKPVTPADFKKGVRSLYLDHYKPVFLIFDQFEELFIFGDKEERRTFIQIVKSLVDSELQCRFIFVMREEYMAWVTEFEKIISTFFSNRVRIEKMSHNNALEAIKGPCNAFNISLEEGFAESLLEKLSPGETDVELTYLQVFLDKIYRIAAGFLPPPGGELKGGSSHDLESKEGPSFSLELLNKTGNVSDLLGSFLEEQISLMENPDTAMSVLKAFISGKGTKRPANDPEVIDNIRSFGKEIPSEKVTELIQSFIKLRVLRDKDDNGRYELRHDALAEKIYDKFSTTEKELLEIRQFIENSNQSYLKRKILLSSDDLSYISNKDSLLNLNSDLKGFLEESRKHQKAKAKVVRQLIFISAIAIVLLIATIVYYLLNYNRVNQSVSDAKNSISQYTRPIDKLCSAGAAWKAKKGQSAREALLKAFNALIRNPGEVQEFIKLSQEYLADFKPVSSPIEFAQCSMDNRFIYGYSADSIFIWSKNGELFSGFSSGKSPLISLLMSDDGENIGAVNLDSMLTVWDNKGNIRFTVKTGYNFVNKNQIFRFTKDNKILKISDKTDADLIDIKGNIIQSFDLHKGSVNAVDISDDGKFIATASSDSTINIWYFNSDQQRFDYYNTITAHHDTVWSVDFAKNNRYLVSTSADEKVSVTSINNEEAHDYYKSYMSSDEVEISLGFPFFSEFDESGSGIIIQSTELKYNQERNFMAAIYVDIYYHIAQIRNINKFDYLRFSPDKKYLVYVLGDDVSLIFRFPFINNVYRANNYRLLQMNGQKPFFSSDGKYIYTICGKHLESWFIDIETISGIALDFYNKWDKYLQ
jgi:WD40 repeat protein